MSVHDWGKQAKPHLSWILKSGLKVWGYDAEIYPPDIYENEYTEIYPENVNPEKLQRCKLLLSQPIAGVNISNDFITLADVEQTVQITTDVKLVEGTVLKVVSPDAREYNLRVTVPLCVHPLSEIHWIYKAVMT